MATAELSDLQKLELKEAFDEFDKVNFKIIMKLISNVNIKMSYSMLEKIVRMLLLLYF